MSKDIYVEVIPEETSSSDAFQIGWEEGARHGRTKALMENVKNVPEYASEYKYWVCRTIECELWFYGAYKTESKAKVVAEQIGNAVVIVE